MTISKIASSRFSGGVCGREQSSYSEMGLGAQLFRDQRIRCLLDAVVEKSIGIFRVEDEPRSDRFPKLRVHFLLRILVNHRKQGEVRAVAQAGKLLQCVLGFGGQPVQLSHHEVHHIIGVTLGVNPIRGPKTIALRDDRR